MSVPADEQVKIGSMVGFGRAKEHDVFFVDCESHRIGDGPTETRVRIYFDKNELEGLRFMMNEEGIGGDDEW